MVSYFLGFDIGSHVSKAVITGHKGKIIASASLEHKTQMSEPGFQEQNPLVWWEEFKKTLGYLIKDSGVRPSQIKAVGVTGFVPGLVMLDRTGNPVRPAIMHTDIRAGGQLKYINKILKTPINHGYLLPKLLWVRDNEDRNFKSTYKILVPHGYIVHKLTGNFSCDIDTASVFGGVYDDSSNSWADKLCSNFSINKDILPPLFGSTSVVGNITSEASEETGLLESTKVIAGTGDTFSALLGCGAVNQGDMMIYLGTSGTQVYVGGEIADFTDGCHFGKNKAEFAGRIISCGDSLEHFSKLFGFKGWSIPDKKALDMEPGSEGLFVFPHLKQKDADKSSVGNFETIFQLDSRHSRWHIYRSLLEGIAYNIKESFSPYSSSVKRVILSGGGAKSRVFRDIIRDVLGREVYYNPLANGALGVALLAGSSIGEISLQGKASVILNEALVSAPDFSTVKKYETLYEAYRGFRAILGKMYLKQEDYIG